MPGIYVRETSWIDWMQQSENPVLTVPGSYWLCHKHNIYKFIFKYHRTIRTIKHFTYGKELMKIIRRIIKNPPRQGQQFSTNNLLVTYNHTSWTRPDKIFAMTKFKERSAAACSHAFVLTIKVMSLLESSEQATEYDVATCSDQPLVWNTKKLVHSFDNDFPEHSKHTQCNTIEEKIFELKNDKHLDDNFALNKMTKNSMNKDLVKQRIHNKDFNKPQLSLTLNELSENVAINNKQKLNMYLDDSKEKSGKRNNCTISNKQSTLANVEEDRLVSNILKEETVENKDYINKVDEEIIKNNISESDNSEVNSTNVDSVSLPYQYLIEREIEDAKLNIINNKSPILGSKKRKRNEVNEKCSVVSKDLLIVVPETDESDPPTKKKLGSDNITSKSSDITDLVMEGLMFTIRQAQGTVVIEQKTKSELGEVLENSGKIETRNQERCLRNSSLLGLENLITMIESPKKPEAWQNTQNKIMQENTSKCQNTNKYTFNNVNYSFKDICFTNTRLNRTSYNTNKNQYTETYETNIKLTDNEDLRYGKDNKKKGKWEEEKEDIIPEALQNLSSQPSVLSFGKVNKCIEDVTNKDLLLDDVGTEISTKLGVTIERDSLISKKHKLQHEGVINNIKKANIPIIISNEIIATDQIPLPLQKILRNKSSTNFTSINSTNETEKRNFSYNIHAKRLSLYYNILENSQTSTSSKIESSNINAPLLTLEGEDKNIDHTKNKLKENEDKRPASINKVEQLSSRELQDITQEFYQHLLYLEKKKDLNDQHLNLRSKKESVNMIQDPHSRNAHIKMIKFFHDITKGAKVVITRMSTKNIHSIIAKNS